MNDQTQTYELGTDESAQPSEHVVYLKNVKAFDTARVHAEEQVAGKDGEAEFKEAADRAREYMERNKRPEAIRVLTEAHAAYTRRTAAPSLAA